MIFDLSLPHLLLWKLNKHAALNKGSRGAPTWELRMLKHGGMRCGRIADPVCTIILLPVCGPGSHTVFLVTYTGRILLGIRT